MCSISGASKRPRRALLARRARRYRSIATCDPNEIREENQRQHAETRASSVKLLETVLAISNQVEHIAY